MVFESFGDIDFVMRSETDFEPPWILFVSFDATGHGVLSLVLGNGVLNFILVIRIQG